MKDVLEVLASSQRSNRGFIREKDSPSHGPRKGTGNRSILMVLGVLALASCFDQILVPEVDSDGRLTVTNDPDLLSARLTYVEIDVPIDPVVPALFGGAAAPPTSASVKLTLTAELAPPTVDGQVVQATSISPPRRFAFAVS